MAERDIVINSGDFPGNSNKDKGQPKREKKEKIVQSKVVKSKPSVIKKAANIFFKDAADEEDLKTTIIFDYLIPTVKDTVVEMGKMLLEGIFYGSTTSHRKSGGSKPYKVSYSDYYNKKDSSKPIKTDNRITSRNFYDFIFEPDPEKGQTKLDAKREAEKTISTLIDIASSEYETASISDFCDIVGLDDEFTDNNYGWEVNDLVKAKLSPTRTGWRIIFPDPKPINRR